MQKADSQTAGGQKALYTTSEEPELIFKNTGKRRNEDGGIDKPWSSEGYHQREGVPVIVALRIQRKGGGRKELA